MSESKFTPGPWYVTDPPDVLGIVAGDERDVEIATVESDTDAMGIEEGEANARLMAAAPDLLAALKRLLEERNPFQSDEDTCECGEGDGRDAEGNVCEHIQACRAIAKAEAPCV